MKRISRDSDDLYGGETLFCEEYLVSMVSSLKSQVSSPGGGGSITHSNNDNRVRRLSENSGTGNPGHTAISKSLEM